MYDLDQSRVEAGKWFITSCFGPKLDTLIDLIVVGVFHNKVYTRAL